MTDLNEREARPRRLRRLRDVFVGPWMAETERNALEAENADLRAALALEALAAREDTERSERPTRADTIRNESKMVRVRDTEQEPER